MRTPEAIYEDERTGVGPIVKFDPRAIHAINTALKEQKEEIILALKNMSNKFERGDNMWYIQREVLENYINELENE